MRKELIGNRHLRSFYNVKFGSSSVFLNANGKNMFKYINVKNLRKVCSTNKVNHVKSNFKVLKNA